MQRQMVRMELETTPAMKVAVWSFVGLRGPHGRIALCPELNWHKIHFIADVFPNFSKVVC